MSDAAEVAARKEKERLLRERRRQRILAGSSSRLGLITGSTSAKGEQMAEDNAAPAPPVMAEEQRGEKTVSPTGSNTTDGGEAQREEGATNPPPVATASTPEPTVTLTQRRTTRRSEEAEVVPTSREEDGHGTYTGTLTFEEGVELPSPSSLLSQAAGGAEFAATVLPHLAKMTSGSSSAPPKARPSLARASGVVSVAVLAIVLGCAFFFADIPAMQDNALVRLLASDEPEAWLNVRSSSVMVPFFTLEAALILVSILSSRFLAPRQQESSAGVMWLFSLPFGRVFADMSLFLFTFVMSIDLLSLAWPWIATTAATSSST